MKKKEKEKKKRVEIKNGIELKEGVGIEGKYQEAEKVILSFLEMPRGEYGQILPKSWFPVTMESDKEIFSGESGKETEKSDKVGYVIAKKHVLSKREYDFYHVLFEVVRNYNPDIVREYAGVVEIGEAVSVSEWELFVVDCLRRLVKKGCIERITTGWCAQEPFCKGRYRFVMAGETRTSQEKSKWEKIVEFPEGGKGLVYAGQHVDLSKRETWLLRFLFENHGWVSSGQTIKAYENFTKIKNRHSNSEKIRDVREGLKKKIEEHNSSNPVAVIPQVKRDGSRNRWRWPE